MNTKRKEREREREGRERDREGRGETQNNRKNTNHKHKHNRAQGTKKAVPRRITSLWTFEPTGRACRPSPEKASLRGKVLSDAGAKLMEAQSMWSIYI